MIIEALSAQYDIRPLRHEDIDAIYALSCGNEIFYRFHPPFVTKESIEEDMRALPEGKSYDDKYYIGFFRNERLVAVMDLITDFPSKGIAFIGLFMVDRAYQGSGLGSGIIQDCIRCLRDCGFQSIQLGTDQGNPQSNAFWAKNGFRQTGERNGFILRELIL